MSEKKSFVLRLDESTFKMLEVWAADKFRSINGQLEWIIQQQLKASGRLPKVNRSRKHTDADRSGEAEEKSEQPG